MRESSPSCIRAPPETVQPTTLSRCSVAYSNRRVTFSPTTMPMEPIMKLGSITKIAHGRPPIEAVPVTTPSRSPEALRAVSSLRA